VRRVEKVLILRMDALGDTIVTIPLIREVKRWYPGAFLTVVATSRGAPSLEGLDEIDRLMLFDPPGASVKDYLEMAGKLKKERFDCAINVSEKLWAYLFPFLGSVPVRIGFTPGFTQPFKALFLQVLLTHRTLYHNNPAQSAGEHEVERQRRLLLHLGIGGEPGPISIQIDEGRVREARERLRELGVPDHATTIACHLSGKWKDDGYGPEALERIINSATEEFRDAFFLLTYGEVERSWARDFAEKLKSERVFPYSDAAFSRWAAMLKCMSVLVTMDTSASHLGAALGIPVVDVFPERYYRHCSERWYPWKVPHRLVRRKSMKLQAPGRARETGEKEFCSAVNDSIRELISCRT